MEISLQDLFKAMLKRWYILLAGVLVFAIAGFTVSEFFIDKKYDSTMSIYVFPQNTAGTDAKMTTSEATDHVVVRSSSSAFFKIVAQNSGINYTATELKEMFTVTRTNKNLNIVEITCEAKDAAEAQKVLAIYRDILIEDIENLPFVDITLTLQIVDDPSFNESPSSPNVFLYTVVAALLGFVIAAILVIVMQANNVTLKDSEDVQQSLGTVMLGEIPEFRNRNDSSGNYKNYRKYGKGGKYAVHAQGAGGFKLFKKKNNEYAAAGDTTTQLIKGADAPFYYKEAFNLLALNLRYSLSNDIARTIAITSTGVGGGKSTISSNLAIALAAMGDSVVVVGFDLRLPVLHTYLDVKAKYGVTNILCGECTLDEAIVKSDIENMDVVVGGTPTSSPTRLLVSDACDKMFEDLAKRYKWVIVDTPPIGVVSDALVVAEKTNYVVVVVDKPSDLKKDVKKTVDHFKAESYSLLGVVFNRAGGKKIRTHSYEKKAKHDYARQVNGETVKEEN